MKKNNNRNLINILLLLILVIGIGYAYLTSNLSINGTTEIANNSWDIHFENLNVSEGSITASTPATIQSNNVDITYSIRLERPKDYYEFTVDVKNDGTLPGKVSISNLAGITSSAEQVIDYTITYINGNPVNVGDIINAGAKKTIKVKVYYKDDISSTDLPSSNINLTLTYTLQYVQSEEDEFDTNALIEQLKEENSSCIYQYTGDITDEVGNTETVTAATSKVYFNRCADKRNIKFNNMCWQMIRTTQTGGIKMIYNGEPDGSGHCDSGRTDHKGFVVSGNSSYNIGSAYLYGSSFTYDTINNTFTLTDAFTSTWSDSTYDNLIGKFTCRSTSDTCETIYEVNSYSSNNYAYLATYKISNTNYANVGTSVFNANHRSPAMVGYMFNKVYYYENTSANGSVTGNDVSYSNGIYTLLPASGESSLGSSLDNTHHYTCNNTTGTCNKVRYYYYNNYYIELDGEANIEEAVNNMLYNDNVNRYNSSIKGMIDVWYKHNMISKTNMLEDTVYCNARNMTNQAINGWNKDGYMIAFMFFKNNILNNDLSCANITDQFSMTNNKAKLTYPVALLQSEEIKNIDSNSLLSTGKSFWGLSPNLFRETSASVIGVSSDGSIYNSDYVYANWGIRPVISLKSGTTISEGDGSESNPWIVQE